MALNKGQSKPVGILPFNLADFIDVSSSSVMKMTFAKCFDKKAAIILTTSSKELDKTSDIMETESNATFETISDTYSECSMSQSNIDYQSPKPIQSSFELEKKRVRDQFSNPYLNIWVTDNNDDNLYTRIPV